MFDLDRHQRDYAERRHAVIDGMLPADYCAQLRQRVRALAAQPGLCQINNCEPPPTERVTAGTGTRKFLNLEDVATRAHMPELCALETLLLPLVSLVTRSDATPEGVNVKIYSQGGGTLGRHVDENPITCLLYLTDNAEGALTLEHGPTATTLPRAGRLVIMNGHTVHSSSPLSAEADKIVVQFVYGVKS